MKRLFPLILCCLLPTSFSSTLEAADHLDAPLVEEDGRTDINDIYAFQSPSNPDNTVLIMTVNPLAGILNDVSFDPRANYDFNVDTDRDAIAELVLRLKFSAVGKGRNDSRQNMILQLCTADDCTVLGEGKTSQQTSLRGGGVLTAGVFDDPFFFDLVGFQNGFNFTGDDFFAGLNVSAIVIEVPSVLFGTNEVGVWCTTHAQGVQIDRMGRPAINTVLIPSGRKDEFNQSQPVNDFEQFGDDVEEIITSLSGDADLAAILTAILLPDILTVDTASDAGFLNGRQLADDVIDAELNLLTGGALTGDGVDANDREFNDRFPFLAAPHPVE